ncbi:Uncharacterised protein [Achromobacter xylosoxidans]|nr:Uncharacterised protein [Achromobacter xylosoxidans]
MEPCLENAGHLVRRPDPPFRQWLEIQGRPGARARGQRHQVPAAHGTVGTAQYLPWRRLCVRHGVQEPGRRHLSDGGYHAVRPQARPDGGGQLFAPAQQRHLGLAAQRRNPEPQPVSTIHRARPEQRRNHRGQPHGRWLSFRQKGLVRQRALPTGRSAAAGAGRPLLLVQADLHFQWGLGLQRDHGRGVRGVHPLRGGRGHARRPMVGVCQLRRHLPPAEPTRRFRRIPCVGDRPQL